jgi:hypothetical protein
MSLAFESFIGYVVGKYYSSKLGQMAILGIIGILGIPIMNVVEKYIFSDWDFLGFLLILLFLDTALGIWKGIKYNNFSSNIFGNLFKKVAIYCVCLISIHSISSYMHSSSVSGNIELFKTIAFHFDNLFYFSIMFRELWSINENINALGYKFLPAFILKHMKDFDERGNYIMRNDSESKSDA